MMTVIYDGRFGNKVGQYAALLALAQQYDYKPVVHYDMKQVLRKYFPRLLIPTHRDFR